MPNHTIYIGDSYTVLKTLPSESINLVVTSPPYYLLRVYTSGDTREVGLETSPNDYVSNLKKVFAEVFRVLKPTGTFFLNIGDSHSGDMGSRSGYAYYPGGDDVPRPITTSKIDYDLPRKSLLCIPERVMFACLDIGYTLRNKIIWVKYPPLPESVEDRLSHTWEYIYFFTKSEKYYFNLDAVKVPYSEGTVERIKRFIKNKEYTHTDDHKWQKQNPLGSVFKYGNIGKSNQSLLDIGSSPVIEENVTKSMQLPEHIPPGSGGGHTLYNGINSPGGKTRQITKYIHDKGVERPGNVDGWVGYDYALELDVDNLKKNPGDFLIMPTAQSHYGHYASFPIDLPKFAILAGCPEGGIVLDPFCGTSTSNLAAELLGRDSIGIELNKEYVSIIKDRFSSYVGQVRFDGKKTILKIASNYTEGTK